MPEPCAFCGKLGGYALGTWKAEGNVSFDPTRQVCKICKVAFWDAVDSGMVGTMIKQILADKEVVPGRRRRMNQGPRRMQANSNIGDSN